METFNYKQVRAGDFSKACVRIKELYSLNEELEAKVSRSSSGYSFTPDKTDNYACLQNEITSKSEAIARRRKTVKVLILIFSLIAITLLWRYIGTDTLGYIPYIVGGIVCLVAFLVSWFSEIGTDATDIRFKLRRKYSAKLREAERLDQANAESNTKKAAEMKKAAEHDQTELKKVRNEIAYYGRLYDLIVEYAEEIDRYNVERRGGVSSVDLIIRWLVVPIFFNDEDKIIDGGRTLLERKFEVRDQLSLL